MTPRQLTIGSLFSGIGGLELGLEWAGLGPVLWQVERDEWCRRVLARHWPSAERFDDVCSVGAESLRPVDVICGGFPCQQLSHANARTRVGLAGAASGLWREFARIVDATRPRAVIVENVADAWRSWVPFVRSDLRRSGYASLPIRLSAEDVGAPFRGARVFVVAAADGDGESARAVDAQVALLPELAAACRKDWGRPAPRALGMADGIPGCVERLRAVGNAVVPAMAEVIGRIVASAEGL